MTDSKQDREYATYVESITADVLADLSAKDFFNKLDATVFPNADEVRCNHSLETSDAILVELGYGNAEREDILAVFRSRGGYCDCEVIYNAEPDEPRDYPTPLGNWKRQAAKIADKEQ